MANKPTYFKPFCVYLIARELLIHSYILFTNPRSSFDYRGLVNLYLIRKGTALARLTVWRDTREQDNDSRT